MRLWHYKFIKYLPNSQLIAQWRELNSIYKNQPNHILINYCYKYPKNILLAYSKLIYNEMINRNIKIKSLNNLINYFNITNINDDFINKDFSNIVLFKYHHTNQYLKQCFYNLQEKYDRAQKDFDNNKYTILLNAYLHLI